MWYVVDAEEGACLYHGFNREISKDEFAKRIEEDTLLEVLIKYLFIKEMYFLSGSWNNSCHR